MNIIYKRTEGSQADRPLEVDTTSSAKKVYLRKNIERVKKAEAETGETYEVWEYDEAIITHAEYEQYLTEELNKVTPYTVTKTAYYGDTETIFYDVPDGNMSVFVKDIEGNYPNYTVNKAGSTVTVNFEAVQNNTVITLSIL